MLKDHSRLAADLLDVADVVGQLDAVDNDAAGVVLFQPVDAADQCRLAGTRWPHYDNHFLSADVQVDIFESLEVAKELVDAQHLDDDVTPDLASRRRIHCFASSFSNSQFLLEPPALPRHRVRTNPIDQGYERQGHVDQALP